MLNLVSSLKKEKILKKFVSYLKISTNQSYLNDFKSI